ncbi:MAG: DUF1926 domain-containing protein [Actinomycetota bacterium]|nr:DUF1926 domain-containing protein [Actinomycetota bacterium]
MTRRISFVLGLHSHQPVGNPPSVIELAYQQAYLPFLQVLESHPRIKATLHYSGVLLEWILQTHPELLEMLGRLIDAKQIEIKTGGFYEPILPIIPDEDKVAQINKLTHFIQYHLHYSPRGMWLAERVWEPHLAKPISDAGVEYVVVDDSHFRYSGLKDEEMVGYYVTEEQGAALKVFPSSMKLRYLIPFKEPKRIIDYLHSLATDRGDRIAIIDDDGEKFGAWPGTYKTVYREGWLENFFNLLEENSDWIDVLTFAECLDKFDPRGRIYLTTASYTELMEWALPTPMALEYERIVRELSESQTLQRYSPFLRGTLWRNFLVKYPESNNMHKKMLYVSQKVHRTNDPKALEELWRGQCNDAYWHGVFGGLYLPHLRSAIYEHLISAEALEDERLHGSKAWAEVKLLDFDKDGLDEVLVETSRLNLYFDPAEGGTLFELDYKPKLVNLLNTLARRPEPYHEKILQPQEQREIQGSKAKTIHELIRVGKEDLRPYLHYDRYRRLSLIDHFLSPDANLSSFKECDYEEQGDFVDQPYEAQVIGSDPPVILLKRRGIIFKRSLRLPLQVQKRIEIPKEHSRFTIDYEIKNPATRRSSDIWFGVEFNFSMPGGCEHAYYHIPGKKLPDNKLSSMGESSGTSTVGIRDECKKLNITLMFDKDAFLWRFPIETVSQSEEGFERTYQSFVLMPSWKFILESQESWKVRIIHEIEEARCHG